MTTASTPVRPDAPPQARTSIRWVIAHEPISTFEAAARLFARLVGEKTGGALDVEVLSATQAGRGRRMSPAEAVSLVASGGIEMCQTYTSAFGRLYEPLWALDLPYLFRDHDHASRVLDGPVGAGLRAGLLPHGIRALSFTYSGGFRVMTTSDRELREPGDLRGLRVRTAETPVAAAVMEALGAVPVPAPLDETAALARDGRIDAAEVTYPRYADQGLHETHRVVSETGHSLLLTMMTMNDAFFRSLPTGHQRAVEDAAREAALLERSTSIAAGEAVKKACPEKGIRCVAPSPDGRRGFIEQTRGVYGRFENRLGRDLIEALRA